MHKPVTTPVTTLPMYIPDDMFLEIAEYLSDYDTHCNLTCMNKKHLLKYYCLKNYYDYNFEVPSGAIATKLNYDASGESIDVPLFSDNITYNISLHYFNDLEGDLLLPNNINKLKLEVAGGISKNIKLPQNINELYIDIDYGNSVGGILDHLPSKLKSLEVLSKDFDKDIKSFPNGLEKLELYLDYFDHKLPLPYGLKHLSLNLWDYGREIQFPSNLISLELCGIYNQKINCLKNLDKLETLDLGYYTELLLPSNLTKLTCIYYYYKHLTLPNGLKKIIIEVDEPDNPIEFNKLPSELEHFELHFPGTEGLDEKRMSQYKSRAKEQLNGVCYTSLQIFLPILSDEYDHPMVSAHFRYPEIVTSDSVTNQIKSNNIEFKIVIGGED
jgi:hypothetical protein